jgi:hypothetical protein
LRPPHGDETREMMDRHNSRSAAVLSSTLKLAGASLNGRFKVNIHRPGYAA